jgi:transcriptional regulator with XRE-family HTH domain
MGDYGPVMNSAEDEKLLDRISSLCMAKRLSQKVLAAKLRISNTSFNKFLNRRRRLPLNIATKLREWLDFEGGEEVGGGDDDDAGAVDDSATSEEEQTIRRARISISELINH